MALSLASTAVPFHYEALMNYVTPSNAALLLGAATAFGLPFAYAWAQSKALPSWQRFVIACIASFIVGVLTAYSSGQVRSDVDIVQNAATIVTLSYGVYYGVFRGLGLESVLFPRAGVVTEAQKSVAAQISTLSSETIKDVVDPTCPTSIVVSAEKVETAPNQDPVIPKG